MKVWIVGARGTVATTAVVGTIAAQRGWLDPEGMLTQTAPFTGLELPAIQEIRFGGCDLRPGTMDEAARASAPTVGVFSPRLLEAVSRYLEEIPITRGILRGGGAVAEVFAGAGIEKEATAPARAAIDRISQDIRAFSAGDETVVVNLASTEPLADPALLSWDLEALERALDEDDPRIPASCLYAYAALRNGIPYLNFTPSTGASLPALVELARTLGVPVAGRDGKTGETLVKTALAPMFAIRALTVEGWYGANILGNTDGRVLADPVNRASKIVSKGGVLERCLGYAPDGGVRIDFFPPLADHKVAWNFIQFRGWGGHRMRMQFIWEGTDAALAAPLVLDLARLVVFAHRRGEAGPIGALGLFFKNPEGNSEMNLHRQYEELLRWAVSGPAAHEADVRLLACKD